LLVVERRSVPPAAVLAEFLAMIGGEDHDRLLPEPASTEVVEQHSEVLVQVRDLPRIEAVELLRELRRRIRIRDPRVTLTIERMHEVRVMRVHVVDEEKERRSRG